MSGLKMDIMWAGTLPLVELHHHKLPPPTQKPSKLVLPPPKRFLIPYNLTVPITCYQNEWSGNEKFYI